MNYAFVQDLSSLQQRINHFLQHKLSSAHHNTPLIDAISYALLLGGKRIRPFLIYATGRMLGVDLTLLDHSAAAMEAIHAYSLTHDDLPAMDNDSLRRGQPTCHIAFDEATAILAGDALQSLAFEWIASDSHLSDWQKVEQIRLLAQASGANGMCLGQHLDLQAEQKDIDIAQLECIHRHKTGALIECAVMMGLNLSAYAQHAEIKKHLSHYAQAIGLAFQVQDDILDVIGQSEKTGKSVGADQSLQKSTYPKLLGLTGAMSKAQQLTELAYQSLSVLPFETTALRELANFIIQREN